LENFEPREKERYSVEAVRKRQSSSHIRNGSASSFPTDPAVLLRVGRSRAIWRSSDRFASGTVSLAALNITAIAAPASVRTSCSFLPAAGPGARRRRTTARSGTTIAHAVVSNHIIRRLRARARVARPHLWRVSTTRRRRRGGYVARAVRHHAHDGMVGAVLVSVSWRAARRKVPFTLSPPPPPPPPPTPPTPTNQRPHQQEGSPCNPRSVNSASRPGRHLRQALLLEPMGTTP